MKIYLNDSAYNYRCLIGCKGIQVCRKLSSQGINLKKAIGRKSMLHFLMENGNICFHFLWIQNNKFEKFNPPTPQRSQKFVNSFMLLIPIKTAPRSIYTLINSVQNRKPSVTSISYWTRSRSIINRLSINHVYIN